MAKPIKVDLLVNGERRQLGNLWQEKDFSVYFSVAMPPIPGRVTTAHLREASEWSSEPETQRRLAYHTTGRVNYHALLPIKPRYFQPLFDVDRINTVFALSFREFDRLAFVEVPASDQALVIDVGRRSVLSLGWSIIPTALRNFPACGAWGRVDFEHFAYVIHEMPADFNARETAVHAYAPSSPLPSQAIGRDEAELAYVQKGRGGEMVIFGPDGTGAYALYPSVVMRVTPRVIMSFKHPKYVCLVDDARSKPHKIVLRIDGPAGRIKTNDLSEIIASIELDAELY